MTDRFTTGPTDTVNKLNRMLDDIDGIRKISGSTYINVDQFSSGTLVTLDTQKLAELFPDAGEAVDWAKVVQGLTYPDPDADPGDPDADPPIPPDPLYAGRSFYKMRLISSSHNVWEAAKEYIPDEQATNNDLLYTCLLQNIGIQPGVTDGWEAFWQEAEEIIVDRALGNTEVRTDFDLRNYVPWYVEGEIVPLVKRNDVYYIWQTLSYTGTPSNASIRFDNNEKKTTAVFK